jgi:flagellar basal-body rod modification protein FlgD
MPVESIGVVADNAVSAEGLRRAALGEEDFLRILLAQLSFQDPLKPIDNQEFIAQIAQFSGLEINRQSNEKADALLTFQSANQAVALIGKQVQVNTDGGGFEVGMVTTVTFQEGAPMLTVLPSVNGVPGNPLPPVGLARISLVREGAPLQSASNSQTPNPQP